MRKYLELEVTKREAGQVEFRISKQTHRGPNFGAQGFEFVACNDITLRSCWCPSITNLEPKPWPRGAFYVRGADVTSDHQSLVVPELVYEAIRKAVDEYNSYFHYIDTSVWTHTPTAEDYADGAACGVGKSSESSEVEVEVHQTMYKPDTTSNAALLDACSPETWKINLSDVHRGVCSQRRGALRLISRGVTDYRTWHKWSSSVELQKQELDHNSSRAAILFRRPCKVCGLQEVGLLGSDQRSCLSSAGDADILLSAENLRFLGIDIPYVPKKTSSRLYILAKKTLYKTVTLPWRIATAPIRIPWKIRKWIKQDPDFFRAAGIFISIVGGIFVVSAVIIWREKAEKQVLQAEYSTRCDQTTSITILESQPVDDEYILTLSNGLTVRAAVRNTGPWKMVPVPRSSWSLCQNGHVHPIEAKEETTTEKEKQHTISEDF